MTTVTIAGFGAELRKAISRFIVADSTPVSTIRFVAEPPLGEGCRAARQGGGQEEQIHIIGLTVGMLAVQPFAPTDEEEAMARMRRTTTDHLLTRSMTDEQFLNCLASIEQAAAPQPVGNPRRDDGLQEAADGTRVSWMSDGGNHALGLSACQEAVSSCIRLPGSADERATAACRGVLSAAARAVIEAPWADLLLGLSPSDGESPQVAFPTLGLRREEAGRRRTVFLFWPPEAAGLAQQAVLSSVLGGGSIRAPGTDQEGGRTLPRSPYLDYVSPPKPQLTRLPGGPGEGAYSWVHIEGVKNEWAASLESPSWLAWHSFAAGPPDWVPPYCSGGHPLATNLVPILDGRGWFCQSPVADIFLMPPVHTVLGFMDLMRDFLIANELDRESRKVVGRLLARLPEDVKKTTVMASCRMAEVAEGVMLAAAESAQEKTAAESRCTRVLLTGETGTGKEVLARALHKLSNRGGEIVSMNCAGLVATLADSQLFGCVKGAHDKALEDTSGFVAEADGGTLFLDEIHQIPESVLPKLLRFLQDGSYYRLGEQGKQDHSDCMVVAATNSPGFETDPQLAQAGLPQRFTRVIRLPPLRERPADIAALVERFFRQAMDALGKGPPKRDVLGVLWARECNEAEFVDRLKAECLRQTWEHGNVRELQAYVRGEVERLVLDAYSTAAGGRAAGLDAFVEGEVPRQKPGRQREILSDEDVLEALRETADARGAEGRSAALGRRLEQKARAATSGASGNTVAVIRLVKRVRDEDDRREALKLWRIIKGRRAGEP